jgi:anti-sigma B factor antagonist
MNNMILPGFDEDACDSLSIALHRLDLDDCLAMKLVGQIDAFSASYFQKSVEKAINAGFTSVVLLLGGVDYISSTGVGALLRLQKMARERDGDISLVDVRPKIMEIFRIMCLERLFSCPESQEEAIQRLREAKPVFPGKVKCPGCGKELRVSRPGLFRCPGCRSTVTIDERGVASTG